METPGNLARLSLALLLGAGIAGVWPALPAAVSQNQEAPEIKSQETTPTFTVRAQRNEVEVRVVVHDAKGNAVGGLTKDDFRLSDNGKPQVVTVFMVESNKAALAAKPPASASTSVKSAEPSEAAPVLAMAQRYVALYFDDLVVTFEDLARTRAAAERYLDSSMQPADRAGLFTSSGLEVLDFTDDRAKLRQALASLRPHPQTVPAARDCPPLTPYEAYLIAEAHDSLMLNIATWEVITCFCEGDSKHCPDAESRAQMAAQLAWQNGQGQSKQSLRVLMNLVRRMGSLPGQRSVLWLSQGFLSFDLYTDLDELIDRALREHVVISALDARGLWTETLGGEDASDQSILPLSGSGLSGGSEGPGPSMRSRLSMYLSAEKKVNEDVMAQVSHDTGGVFVHDTNDYDAGFRMAGALPEFSYLLAFSPQNLKYDGKLHKLKVELVNAKGLSVQARSGYFAPNQELRPEERTRREIEDAVLSQEEYREFPVDLETQFFKLKSTEARVSIMARVDARAVHFRKEGDRNLVNFRVVCTAFDHDGKLADGMQRDVELRLHEATLAHVMSAGLKLPCQLKLGVGTYALRVVVYDTDSARMTALNGTVEIPF